MTLKFKILLITILLGLSNSNNINSPKDFDNELNSIVQKFKSNIMDQDECERLKRATDDLVDEIEDALEMAEQTEI